MHQARLDHLSVKHAPQRKISSFKRTATGTKLLLECGHTGEMAPHVNPVYETFWRCCSCGTELVKTSPVYKSEFDNA